LNRRGPMGSGEVVESTKPRVLLVEDHVDSREALRRLLARAGFVVLTADGYHAALALGRACPFDVLVTDLRLADGDGRALLRALRPAGDCPAVLVTGSSLAPNEEKLSLDAGFCVHLTKPLVFAQLLEAIERCAAMIPARS